MSVRGSLALVGLRSGIGLGTPGGRSDPFLQHQQRWQGPVYGVTAAVDGIHSLLAFTCPAPLVRHTKQLVGRGGVPRTIGPWWKGQADCHGQMGKGWPLCSRNPTNGTPRGKEWRGAYVPFELQLALLEEPELYPLGDSAQKGNEAHGSQHDAGGAEVLPDVPLDLLPAREGVECVGAESEPPRLPQQRGQGSRQDVR